jgi:Fibronectin type III domain
MERIGTMMMMGRLRGGLAAALVALAGCGGGSGGGGGTPTTPPVPPDPLVASVTGADSIALAWSETAAGLTGHEVERATASGGPFARVATPPGAATGYGDTGLTVGTTYWYRVRSLNAAGPSAWTGLASATPAAVPPSAPAAPSGLTAAATATDAITLTWSDNSSNETGFEVERASAATGPFGLVKTTAADATTWTDTGLPPGTPSWYRIRAVNGAGASTTEGPASATTGLPVVPAAPTGLAAAGRASGTAVVVDVSWTNVATNASSYELQKYWGSVGTYGASIVLPAGSTSYLDEAPANMFTNHYRVRAVNAAGPSAWTELSIYVGVVFIAPCPPPTAATATATSDTTAHLAWTVSTSGNCALNYVERSLSATGPWSRVASVMGYFVVGLGWVPGNAFDDSGLTPGGTYFYRVYANGGSAQGDSVPTAVLSVTTPGALGVPGGLTGAAASGVKATLGWTNGAGSDGTAIEWATAAAGPFTEAFTVGTTFTAAEVTGLTPGTAYWFQVRATRGAQRSAPSNVVTVTTPASLALPVTADTLLFASTALGSWQANNYSADFDSVGCSFTWMVDTLYQIYLFHHCAGSALAFDTRALTGRTVLAARLEMWVCHVPTGPMNTAIYAVSALAGPWPPATVTYNTLPTRLGAGRVAVYAPSTAGKTAWDVTAIVRGWASGAVGSNGLYVEQLPVVDHRFLLPGGGWADIHDQTTGYCSIERNGGSAAYVPTLYVDYQ